MIYTRTTNKNSVMLDYDGTNEDLRNEILLIIETAFENKDLEEVDLAVMIATAFEQIEDETKKIALIRVLIDKIKEGKLWQELEGLNKQEKK
jgi:hypothetical protein